MNKIIQMAIDLLDKKEEVVTELIEDDTIKIRERPDFRAISEEYLMSNAKPMEG